MHVFEHYYISLQGWVFILGSFSPRILMILNNIPFLKLYRRIPVGHTMQHLSLPQIYASIQILLANKSSHLLVIKAF